VLVGRVVRQQKEPLEAPSGSVLLGRIRGDPFLQPEVVEIMPTAEKGRDLSGADTDGRSIGLWLHGKSEATKEAYRWDLAKFVDFTEGKPLRTVTLADVQDFTDFISELLAPASRARILAALKSLFAFGHQVGYLPFDVGRPVKLPPPPR
jgi:hypothetical protein